MGSDELDETLLEIPTPINWKASTGHRWALWPSETVSRRVEVSFVPDIGQGFENVEGLTFESVLL